MDQLECQKSHLLEKEREYAGKIKQQEILSQQLEEKCRSVQSWKSMTGRITKQLQEKQQENERHWSKLTNTWSAEKICRDQRIEELESALKTAKEQQVAKEKAWKTAVEEEKSEKTAQVNNLIEKVKGMEMKQVEISQDMERKLPKILEQIHERCQKDIQLMQEEFKRKLDREIQRYISSHSGSVEIGNYASNEG